MKMEPEDKELIRRIEEVAHYIWDPIGVSDNPQARDEYSGYMLAIFGRVKSGSESQIVEYMKMVETENMGLSFNHENAIKAARIMLEWKEYLSENT